MFKDVSPRQSGKTTRMIEWLKGSPKRLLIVPEYGRAVRLRKQFPLLGRQIISFEQYKQGYNRGEVVEEVAIDDADDLLALLVMEPLARISISANEPLQDGLTDEQLILSDLAYDAAREKGKI